MKTEKTEEDEQNQRRNTETIARLKEVCAEKRIQGKAIYQCKRMKLIPDQEKKEKPEERHVKIVAEKKKPNRSF